MESDALTLLRIGATGHRLNRLPKADWPLLARRVRAVLATLAETATPEVVVSLAEGADRVIATEALAAGHRLVCVLPFRRDRFALDFATSASRSEFAALLDRADAVIEPADDVAGGGVDEAGYAAAGATIMARAELLLAVWDGDAARGVGGTPELVARARSAGLPVVWVVSWPPHPIRLIGVPGQNGPLGSAWERLERLAPAAG